MIAQMHQFTGAGCQMIETTLKRRGFSLKRLLIHGAVCVKQFDDIFIEPRHTPSSIPLKGKRLIARHGAGPGQKGRARRPRGRLFADSEKDLLHDVLCIGEVWLDREHIAEHRLLMPHKQLLHMQHVVVRERGG